MSYLSQILLPLTVLPLNSQVPAAGQRLICSDAFTLGASAMRIGVPREIKVHEYRVGLVPAGVRELTATGHEVILETGAGDGIGLSDAEYRAAGATIAPDAADVFAKAQLIVKVKEPQLPECRMLRPGQVLFTYLHLAPDPAQARALMASGATAIAYETVTRNGSLPLLTPMSEVAGRMSIQVGAACLQKANGGRGVLLGGVPGVPPAKVVILGGGVSGTHAAEMAVGLRADVTVVDRSVDRLRELSSLFGASLRTAYSTTETIERLVREADLVIGAVLIAGAAAPKLVTRAMVAGMQPGSVLVDISIDQGGCFETSHPTTHAQPTFVVDGVVHYCVANMPGAVARTSTFALTNATLPYVRMLADLGWQAALKKDSGFAAGLNVHAGQITHPAVAQALNLEAHPLALTCAAA
jgi:alanine dehydrogenase